MKAYTDQGYVAGVVTLVQHNGVLAELDATGWQDIEGHKPMATDTIFQIMSMTKPITGAAIMMLAEEGKLRLLDPVEKHLPEFKGQKLAVTNNGVVSFTKPARLITIRDLMTHTSGMSGKSPASIPDILMKMDLTLADAVAIYAKAPLEFEPGTKWQYSNTGLATLGRIVEVVSGMPYEKFLETRIFQPLGMTDTHIVLPKEKRGRLAPVYVVGDDGKLSKAGANTLAGDPLKFREGAKYSGPEYAVYSTAHDLANFYQMMLNKGVFQGHRLLSPAGVQVMTSDHTAGIKSGWVAGSGFGLTWEVTRAGEGTLNFLSEGSFHHGGAFGTFGFIDPKRNLVGVYMVQIEGPRSDVRDSFLEMAESAILQ